MQTAGARALREDDNEMSREAVLLQWERKIEDAERLESGRVGDEDGRVDDEDGPIPEDDDGPIAEPVPLRPYQEATRAGPRRFERSARPGSAEPDPTKERRTIRIAGQPAAPRRRRSVMETQMAQPDRIALWAFLLGLFLVAVAAGTAHT